MRKIGDFPAVSRWRVPQNVFVFLSCHILAPLNPISYHVYVCVASILYRLSLELEVISS